MSYKIDLHVHTNINPHAFSTLEENLKAAKEKGMSTVAITNHGPALQDSPHWWGLANMCIIPEYIDGVRILKGVEVNILDEYANIDINQKIYKVMDIVIGGFHDIPEYGETGDIDKNTKAIINLFKSQKIDIGVHLGNPQFPIRYDEVVKAAKECNIAIELNNTSLTIARRGSAPNCLKIAELAKKEGCYISYGSDAHFSSYIGGFEEVEKLVEKVGYPEELIINSSEERLNNFLEMRKSLKPKNL
ncbi:MAG: phosphatase [Fusobacteriaceae bacterium]|nr:phosphatase [Fusobacteriaceae bacterium]